MRRRKPRDLREAELFEEMRFAGLDPEADYTIEDAVKNAIGLISDWIWEKKLDYYAHEEERLKENEKWRKKDRDDYCARYGPYSYRLDYLSHR